MKKFVSLLIVIITVLSLMPVTTFAVNFDVAAVSDEVMETPSEEPTEVPTEGPTETPTEVPTEEPTEVPTEQPTEQPTEEPTQAPTEAPTKPVAPKKVDGFKIKSKTTKEVVLSWKKQNSTVTRFYVYRAKENGNSFSEMVLIKTINDETKTSYTDKTIQSGALYQYRIIPSNYSNGKDTLGKGSNVKVFVPLEKTKEVKVVKATTSKIKIKWAAIPNATKYEIYRRNSGASTAQKIGTTKSKNYTDKKITSGEGYTYYVRGVRVANKSLRYSEFTSLTTAASVTTVKGIKVKSYMRRGLLSWDAVSGADGYAIYKKNNKGKYKYLDSTKYTNYLTPKLIENKGYTLQIKAYKLVNGEKVFGKTKTVKLSVVDGAYGKKAGDTYVEICLETQTMYMYVNNKLYAKTPVVSGFYNAYDTTKGFHYAINKSSPARLRGSAGNDTWDVQVNYWVAFTYDGQGLHDSTWRYSGYGGEIYKRDGSHGCINTPLDAMSKIYKKVYVGMPIIVY